MCRNQETFQKNLRQYGVVLAPVPFRKQHEQERAKRILPTRDQFCCLRKPKTLYRWTTIYNIAHSGASRALQQALPLRVRLRLSRFNSSVSKPIALNAKLAGSSSRPDSRGGSNKSIIHSLPFASQWSCCLRSCLLLAATKSLFGRPFGVS